MLRVDSIFFTAEMGNGDGWLCAHVIALVGELRKVKLRVGLYHHDRAPRLLRLLHHHLGQTPLGALSRNRWIMKRQPKNVSGELDASQYIDSDRPHWFLS